MASTLQFSDHELARSTSIGLQDGINIFGEDYYSDEDEEDYSHHEQHHHLVGSFGDQIYDGGVSAHEDDDDDDEMEVVGVVEVHNAEEEQAILSALGQHGDHLYFAHRVVKHESRNDDEDEGDEDEDEDAHSDFVPHEDEDIFGLANLRQQQMLLEDAAQQQRLKREGSGDSTASSNAAAEILLNDQDSLAGSGGDNESTSSASTTAALNAAGVLEEEVASKTKTMIEDNSVPVVVLDSSSVVVASNSIVEEPSSSLNGNAVNDEAPKKKTLDPKASTFVFNPNAATFQPFSVAPTFTPSLVVPTLPPALSSVSTLNPSAPSNNNVGAVAPVLHATAAPFNLPVSSPSFVPGVLLDANMNHASSLPLDATAGGVSSASAVPGAVEPVAVPEEVLAQVRELREQQIRDGSRISYPPWMLLHFQQSCLESPVPLPPEIDVYYDFDYVMGVCPPFVGAEPYVEDYIAAQQWGEEYELGVQNYELYRQQMIWEPEDEATIAARAAANANRVRYDRGFLLSLRDKAVAPTEQFDEDILPIDAAAAEAAASAAENAAVGDASTPNASSEVAASASGILPIPSKASKKKKKKAAAAGVASSGTNTTNATDAGSDDGTEDDEEEDHRPSSSTTSAADARIPAAKTPKSSKKKKKKLLALAEIAAATAAAANAAPSPLRAFLLSRQSSSSSSTSSATPASTGAGSSPSGLASPAISRSATGLTEATPAKGAVSAATSSAAAAAPTPGRWRPAMAQTEDALAVKTTRSVLNKLTPEKFDKLAEQMLDIKMTQDQTVNAVADVVVDKAISESAFVSMYTDLVVFLCEKLPSKLSEDLNFSDSLRARTFGYFVSTQRVETMPTEEVLAAMETDEDRDMAIGRAKNRWMGHVVLLAEFYKRGLLNDDELDAVWCRLCSDVSVETAADEDAEALCTFLAHAGESLELLRDDLAGEFFEQLHGIASVDFPFSSRLRFKAEETLALRKAKWVPRRAAVVKPQKLAELHAACSPSSSAFSSPSSSYSSQAHTGSARHHSRTPFTPSPRHGNNNNSSNNNHHLHRSNSTGSSTPSNNNHHSSFSSSSSSHGSSSGSSSSSSFSSFAAAVRGSSSSAGINRSASTPTKSSSSSSSSFKTPVREPAGSAKKESGGAWNRAAWEEEMASGRKARVVSSSSNNNSNNTPRSHHHQQGRTNQPPPSSTPRGGKSSSTSSQQHGTPRDRSSSSSNNTNNTPSSKADVAARLLSDSRGASASSGSWDRTSWEEQMALERKRRVEKGRVEEKHVPRQTPSKSRFEPKARSVHASQRPAVSASSSSSSSSATPSKRS